jgi:hypothetical protein
MYPTWRQVLWALRWLIILGLSFCRFFLFANCFASYAPTRNLVFPAYRSFAYVGFICFRCEDDGPWR